ncbi:S9 family peptidase [Kiloniella sp. b19]|uniref:S9 family peptidase n=1 Tax=Kiloniella sp. GXU_MW_B19 TaxID=3141326 RepID=UPI0031D45EE2
MSGDAVRSGGVVASALGVEPPVHERRDHWHELHGDRRHDPYAWLRAENWQEVMRDPSVLSGDIRAALEAENSYCKAALSETEGLQDGLYEELKNRLEPAESSLPVEDGNWAYYSRFEPGRQHPLFCRCPRAVADATVEPPEDGRYAEEEILLDGNALAEGHDYFQIGGADYSPDQCFYAYAIDTKGSEYYEIRVRDLSTGVLLEDVIESTSGAIVWAEDNATIFYTRMDDNHRPSQVFRHVLGRPAAEDVLVYEEPDSGFFVGVGKSLSGRFIEIDSHDHQTSEIRLLDARRPQSALQLVAPRQEGVEYEVCDIDDHLYIRTNDREAEDFRIARVAVADAFVSADAKPEDARAGWEDHLSHKGGELILSMAGLKDWLITKLRVGGLPRIRLEHLPTQEVHFIAFEEEAFDLGFGVGAEYAAERIRFRYSSMTTPGQLYDYGLTSRERRLRKEQKIPSGHNPADYITRRIEAVAHDGERVPVSILYHKDTKPAVGADGPPLLLMGYGSYGHAMSAGFSTARLSLVDRGFVYAVAHIRGGMDKGYAWYKNGKMERKTNTFRDFVSVAETLRDEGFAGEGKICAHGGSAGGMLMGAIANMRPDLFHAIVADVPFVDVLTTMCDATLPLTPPEWPEWGNPIESRAAYDWIKAYSPYDNVSAQSYPHMLITAGLTDPRVTYWEPAKWAAALREKKTDDNLLLFKTNMSAGHGGASGRFERLKEVALMYAFLLKVCGLLPEKA